MMYEADYFQGYNHLFSIFHRNHPFLIFYLYFCTKNNDMYCETAEYIKASVIDWLLYNHPSIIIGNEVMYGSKSMLVDLLAIVENKTIAIEIKSGFDNLKRLPFQLEEYNKIFDKVIIVTAPAHLSSISQLISKNIGLYVIDKSLKKILSPRLNHKLDKLEMLYSVSSAFLRKQYPQYKSLNSDEIRLQLLKRGINTVHELLVSFYQQRFSERFHFFMNERGEYTLVDDIPTLSSLTRIELL